MRVYFNTETGIPVFTFAGDENLAPPGNYIDVDPSEITGPLTGYLIQNGQVSEVDLTPRKEDSLEEIRGHISTTRKLFITDLPAQGMIYLDKEKEAIAYLAESPEPANADAYPWIKREVGVTGATAYEVAQVFVNMAAQWRYIGPQIEGLRLEANASVNAATSVAEIEATMTNFVTALGSFQ